jgi:NAD(P)-dependent dehydrogenase (short-subunit alcohol dehydrogenase family)
MTLTGTTALVTGSGRGIGQAVAQALAARQARVICHARRESDAGRVAETINGEPVWGDLGSVDGIADVASQVRACTNEVGILILNAGVLHRGGVADTTPEALSESFAVNTQAPLLLTQALLPELRAGHARVVVVSSTMGQFAHGMSGGSIAYRLSKAAVNAFVASAADELSAQGIVINAAHPGWVRTDMGGTSASVDPADAAEALVWLATLADAASTGKFFRDRREIPW